MSRIRWMLAALAATLIALPAAAWAADVFLNGVKVTGMANQTFDDAKVRIDDKGNVHITVEGIKVQRQDSGPNGQVQNQTPQVTKTYWLISDKSAPGMTQYNIDVHINGQFVTRVKSSDTAQLVMNVTKFMRPGKNTVNFTAVKDLAESRKSFSPSHHFTLMLGHGQKQGNAIMIERQLTTYKRTADQVENHGSEAVVEAD